MEEFGGRLLFPQHKHILHIWQMMTIHIAKKPKKQESKELNSIIFFSFVVSIKYPLMEEVNNKRWFNLNEKSSQDENKDKQIEWN